MRRRLARARREIRPAKQSVGHLSSAYERVFRLVTRGRRRWSGRLGSASQHEFVAGGDLADQLVEVEAEHRALTAGPHHRHRARWRAVEAVSPALHCPDPCLDLRSLLDHPLPDPAAHRPLGLASGGQCHLLHAERLQLRDILLAVPRDRKSTRLNSSHGYISYAVFCLKKKKTQSETCLQSVVH